MFQIYYFAILALAINLVNSFPQQNQSPFLITALTGIQKGSVSYYGNSAEDPPPYDGKGACANNPPIDKFVAMNSVQFDQLTPNGNPNNNPLCGQCIKVTNPNNGNSIVLQIADRCPSCMGIGGIDISFNAFGELVGGTAAAANIGRTDVSWEMVECPIDLEVYTPNFVKSSNEMATNMKMKMEIHVGCSKQHKIQAGDTCYELGLANGIDVETVKALNVGIDCLNLQIDSMICLAA